MIASKCNRFAGSFVKKLNYENFASFSVRKGIPAAELVSGKDVRELNEILSEVTSRGEMSRCIELFKTWKSIPENKPDQFTYNFLFQAMVRGRARYDDVLAEFKEMESMGLKPDLFTYKNLIRSALNNRNSFAAEEILKRMHIPPDTDTLNSIVSACAMNQRVTTAIEYLQSMLTSGLLPGKYALNEVLVAAAKTKRTREAMTILNQLKSRDTTAFPATLAELLQASSEAEDPECCLLVVEGISNSPNVVAIDQGTLLMAMNLAARSANVPLADKIWEILPSPETASPVLHLARIQACAGAAHFSRAFALVHALEQQTNQEPWIQHSHKLLCPFTSLSPLTHMLSRGVGVLDNAYYLLADHHSGAVQSSSDAPAAETGSSESESPETGSPLEPVVSLSGLNCIIAGCSLVRDTERAQQTFDELEPTFGLKPNVGSFNALMDGYSRTGKADMVEQLWEQMAANEVLPSGTSYTILAESHIVAHQPAQALQAVNAMRAAGHVPSRDLLMKLLRRCQRAAFMEGMEQTVETMRSIGFRMPNNNSQRREILSHVRQEVARALSQGRRSFSGADSGRVGQRSGVEQAV